MKKIIVTICVIGLMQLASYVQSQTVEISAQLRPRYEFRHGYGSLFVDGEQPGNFVSQRTRLNMKFENEIFRFGFSLQNVGVWGETGTLSKTDINGTAIHEAWGELILNKKLSIKVGRQEIIYDDQRIFGNVDWAQQGRSHDAAILQIAPKEVCRIHLGFAYNALNETSYKAYYGIDNYKAMQFVHWHRDFGDFGASVLILNNGFSYQDFLDTTSSGKVKEKISYDQTYGTRFSLKKKKVQANAAFYYQGGKLAADTTMDGIKESTRKLSAIYFAADVNVNITDVFSLGTGFEYLSGNSMKDPSEKDKAFKPWFGTNHKFNGWMDYFYVGNHMSSVGLIDIFVPFTVKVKKFTGSLIPHLFMSAGKIYAMDENNQPKDFSNMLGTEIDFSVGYAFAKNAVISAGYSQMLATESMEVIKGGSKDNMNNWAWVMIDFKPTFFTSKKE